ncbi:hypothetical protein [Halorussus halobius]|uniref:hypothetical protein n=1 Tax=Halorussus halobius TaxID=1710537 RepID=UPI001092B367|nr:hypothetical protein [Halorussus halobius]
MPEVSEHIGVRGLGSLTVDVEAFSDEVGDSDRVPEDVQEELVRKTKRVEKLEARLADAGEPTVPTDYEAFLEDDVVREQVRDAKENSTASEKYVRAVIAAVLDQGGAVTYDEVTEMPDATDKTHVGRAANALAERRVATVDEEDGAKRVDLNPSGIEEVKQERERRERRREIMDEL